jgi:hypothetical protein
MPLVAMEIIETRSFAATLAGVYHAPWYLITSERL